MNGKRRNIMLSLAGALMCMLFSGCVTEPEGGVKLKTGDIMPRFEVTTLDGDVVSSETLRGSESVIVFFNTECPDCRRELPIIQRQADVEIPQGVKYICISREEGAESVEAFWKEAGLTMPVSAQTTRDIYSRFARSGIPVSFRFDSNLRLISYDDSAQ